LPLDKIDINLNIFKTYENVYKEFFSVQPFLKLNSKINNNFTLDLKGGINFFYLIFGVEIFLKYDILKNKIGFGIESNFFNYIFKLFKEKILKFWKKIKS
jgi:hypothetical protein